MPSNLIDETKDKLRDLLPPGSYVRAEATHRSQSGMTHDVALYGSKQRYGNPSEEVNITEDVALVLERKTKNGGIRVGGTGYDKGGHLKMELSKVLYDDAYLLDGYISDIQKYAYKVAKKEDFGTDDGLADYLLRDHSINDTTSFGFTPLHIATTLGDVDMVERMIKAGADLEIKDKDGNTALHMSAADGFVDVSKTLLAHGADVEAINEQSETPLLGAVINGHVDTVRLLIDNDASVNVFGECGREMLIHASVRENDNSTITALLVEAGADINAQDDEGNTALHVASEYRKHEAIKYLVKQGADASMENQDDHTALDLSENSTRDVLAIALREKQSEEDKRHLMDAVSDYLMPTEKHGAVVQEEGQKQRRKM